MWKVDGVWLILIYLVQRETIGIYGEGAQNKMSQSVLVLHHVQ